jgi:hypothetical protein
VLSSSRSFPAEYDRRLILRQNGKEVAQQELFPDTGGYSSTNLYKCSSKLYMIKGYFDMWVIDLGAGKIEAGQCPESAHEYIGIFLTVTDLGEGCLRQRNINKLDRQLKGI